VVRQEGGYKWRRDALRAHGRVLRQARRGHPRGHPQNHRILAASTPGTFSAPFLSFHLTLSLFWLQDWVGKLLGDFMWAKYVEKTAEPYLTKKKE